MNMITEVFTVSGQHILYYSSMSVSKKTISDQQHVKYHYTSYMQIDRSRFIALKYISCVKTPWSVDIDHNEIWYMAHAYKHITQNFKAPKYNTLFSTEQLKHCSLNFAISCWEKKWRWYLKPNTIMLHFFLASTMCKSPCASASDHCLHFFFLNFMVSVRWISQQMAQRTPNDEMLSSIPLFFTDTCVHKHPF